MTVSIVLYSSSRPLSHYISYASYAIQKWGCNRSIRSYSYNFIFKYLDIDFTFATKEVLSIKKRRNFVMVSILLSFSIFFFLLFTQFCLLFNKPRYEDMSRDLYFVGSSPSILKQNFVQFHFIYFDQICFKIRSVGTNNKKNIDAEKLKVQRDL